MPKLTPGQLCYKMEIAERKSRSNSPYEKMEELLRIVLKAIRDGEVVETKHYYSTAETLVILKPDFQKFMEGV